VNNSSSITASDALSILRAAVGQPVTLGCPDGPFSVVWDGGGDGTSWQDRLNWGGDAVPRFCDSVTIDIAAEASVVYASQTLSILALTSAEDLTVSGGSLTLRQASSVSGKFTLAGGTFTVEDTLSSADFDWTGGTIADGTYVLTSQAKYGASCTSPLSFSETVTIAGDCFQAVFGDILSGTSSGRLTTQGSAIAFTPTCVHVDTDGAIVTPDASMKTYTATATTLTLFAVNATTGASDVSVFTRR
jgi:hypothetical protein